MQKKLALFLSLIFLNFSIKASIENDIYPIIAKTALPMGIMGIYKELVLQVSNNNKVNYRKILTNSTFYVARMGFGLFIALSFLSFTMYVEQIYKNKEDKEMMSLHKFANKGILISQVICMISDIIYNIKN